jgi:hypothetical protein
LRLRCIPFFRLSLRPEWLTKRAPQPFQRRVFAFRRYSVEEDGRLVARTRGAGHHDSQVSSISYLACDSANASSANNSRYKPYERASKPATIQPSNRDVPQTTRDVAQRKQVDGATLSRLFQQLVPLTADPSNFESSAAAICTSFELDPATSAEIIGSFKQRSSTDKGQGPRCARVSVFPCSAADVRLQSARDKWTHCF